MSKTEKASADTVEANNEHLGEVLNRLVANIRSIGNRESGLAAMWVMEAKNDHARLAKLERVIANAFYCSLSTADSAKREKDAIADLHKACGLIEAGDKPFEKIKRKASKAAAKKEGAPPVKDAPAQVPPAKGADAGTVLKLEFGDNEINDGELDVVADIIMDIIDGKIDDVKAAIVGALGGGRAIYFKIDEDPDAVKQSIASMPDGAVLKTVPADGIPEGDLYAG